MINIVGNTSLYLALLFVAFQTFGFFKTEKKFVKRYEFFVSGLLIFSSIAFFSLMYGYFNQTSKFFHSFFYIIHWFRRFFCSKYLTGSINVFLIGLTILFSSTGAPYILPSSVLTTKK